MDECFSIQNGHRFYAVSASLALSRSLSFSLSLSLSLSLSRSLSLSLALLSTALVSKRFAQAPSPTHSISFRSSHIIRQPAPQTALAAQTANHKNGCYCAPVDRDKNRIKSSLCVLDFPFYFSPSPLLSLCAGPHPPPQNTPTLQSQTYTSWVLCCLSVAPLQSQCPRQHRRSCNNWCYCCHCYCWRSPPGG